MKGKGIVLCPCEGNLTVRSSICGHSVHSYNLQTIQQKGGDCRRTNFIQMMRDTDRPNTMTPTSRCLFKLPVKRNGSYSQEVPGGGGAGESAYEGGTDARRLA